MASSDIPEAVSLNIDIHKINSKNIPLLDTLFNIQFLPLSTCTVKLELKNVHTAVVNAIRRVLIDEMPGPALFVHPNGFNKEETTDVYMLPQFVNANISAIRIRRIIAPEIITNLRLCLDVSNKTAAPLAVYSGDLTVESGRMPPYTILNPTTKIAMVAPGKRLVINNIQIMVGGNGAFNNMVCRASYKHLDIEEYSDEDIRSVGGAAANLSGYKIPSTISTPKHHLLTTLIPGIGDDTAEAKTILIDACINIRNRLLKILSYMENPEKQSSRTDIQLINVTSDNGINECIMHIVEETYTIGELLKRHIYEREPNINHISYTIDDNNKILIMTIKTRSDVMNLIIQGITDVIKIFEKIKRDISSL